MLEFIRGLLKTEEKKSEPVTVAENSEPKEAPAKTEPESNFHMRMSYFDKAYREFIEGDEKKLPAVYSYIASGDIKVTVKAAEAVARYMEKLDYTGICSLEDWFRQFTSMEWSIDWKEIEPKSIKTMTKADYLWVLRLGTFHPNGFFREKCIRELKADKASVPFVILRLNDWVKQVRNVAEEACLSVTGMSGTEIIAYLPYLEKVKRGIRANNAVIKEFEDRMAAEAGKHSDLFDKSFVRKYDVKTRKAAYRLFAGRKLLSKDEINSIISLEKNSQIQALLMTLLMDNYDVSTEELDDYLKHKSVTVNYKALECKYKRVSNSWDGLEDFLLAKSAGMRAYVRYILERHTQTDVAAYYKMRLETDNRKICIQGLGECGTKEDAETLKPYLEDSDEGIVKVTLHAIGSLLREDGAEIYWRFLQDAHEVVARQAYREIAAHDVRYGAEKIYDTLIGTESELLKEKLTLMLLKEPVWEALPYRLMLYASEDEAIKNIIHPFNGRISTYSTMSTEHAEWIKSIMADDRYKIPKDLQDKILFSMKYSIK
ncbi:MAG: hypothetical protein IKR39_11190 [Lachnospiraceae bacterium]|nr:hypothetical protein [Lachnospiraceae bacterium]